MPVVPINLLGLLVAAAVNMAIGFVWYSPALFGKPWAKLSGFTSEILKKAQKSMMPMMALAMLLVVVTAFITRHFSFYAENFYSEGALPAALTTAFFAWLGFIMPVQFTHVMYERQPWALFAIHTGYQFVGLMVMSAILAVFG